jgi:hypothetical protein
MAKNEARCEIEGCKNPSVVDYGCETRPEPRCEEHMRWGGIHCCPIHHGTMAYPFGWYTCMG